MQTGDFHRHPRKSSKFLIKSLYNNQSFNLLRPRKFKISLSLDFRSQRAISVRFGFMPYSSKATKKAIK